jgi:hypothetical protein
MRRRAFVMVILAASLNGMGRPLVSPSFVAQILLPKAQADEAPSYA